MLAALLALVVFAAPAGSAGAKPKERGRGTVFPPAGSRAYNALHYHVRLAWSPAGTITAVTAIRARARTDLHAIKLDFRGPHISAIKVDGGGVRWRRPDGKL